MHARRQARMHRLDWVVVVVELAVAGQLLANERAWTVPAPAGRPTAVSSGSLPNTPARPIHLSILSHFPRSYSFTGLDTETFKACPSVPDASSFPNAYRWYLHIAALSGIKTYVRRWIDGLRMWGSHS